jgi:hypothetical protein
VIDRMRWVRAILAPVLRRSLVRLPEPLDLREITADALEMGDEVHNRNRAATALVFRALALALLESDTPARDRVDAARYIADDDFFYLGLSMAAGKATADVAAGIPHATIVTAMARNGAEFGLRVSGAGERWFTAPSSAIHGCYLPGYGPEDANPDMGDSTITETIGLGALAWASSPPIARFAGVTAEDLLRATLAMYEITWSESVNYRLPALGYRGAPLGIDCRKVRDTGIAPIADTGIAHRDPGVGEIGGGYVRMPIEPFVAAAQAVAA